MKKIILLLLLISTLLTILAITSQAQENIIIKYYDDYGTYNTTTPKIVVDFHEKPVNILNKHIYSYTTEEQIRLTLIGQDDINQIYQYKPSKHLGTGKYLLYMEVEDEDLNQMQIYANFSTDPDQMKISVLRPRNRHITQDNEKKYAVSDKQIFNLTLNLERAGTCVYQTTQINGEETLEQAYNRLYASANNRLKPLNTNNWAMMENFSIPDIFGVSEYQYNGNLYPLHIICKEENSINQYAYETIMTGSDITPPEIAIQATPEIIRDSSNPKTNITLQTSDRTVCTIHNTNTGITQTDPQFQIDHPPGYDFTSYEQFKTNDTDIILIPTERPQYEYTFETTCTNLADLQSTKTITIPTDIEQVQDIHLIYPTTTINTYTFQLNVTLNIGEDTCYYAIGNESETYTALTKTEQYHTDNRKIHTATITGQQGQNPIKIKCDRHQEPKQYTITIDQIPPTETQIQTNDYTCSENTVTFTLNGTDDEQGSGIKKYYYNITNNHEIHNEQYIEGTATGSGPLTITKTIPADLEDSTLTIKAYAEDNAGNIQANPTTATTLVTNESIIECDKTPPTITTNSIQNNETKEWTINVTCKDNDQGSGCKPTYDYSTHTINEPCTYENTDINMENPIFLTESAKLCIIIYDNNNNNATKTKEYTTIYPRTCYNEEQDPGETDLDCGGQCPRCEINQSCLIDTDCTSLYCTTQQTCQEPSCSDNQQNGQETDLDCGGEACTGCDIGKSCRQDQDCLENNCLENICQEPSCTDGKIDGDETYYDCGGPDCEPCKEGETCETDNDCETNYECSPDKKCWLSRTLDSDGDGIPDWWEKENGLDPYDPNDASQDNDNDKYTNLEEYKNETDPNNPSSHPDYLKLTPLTILFLSLGLLSIISGTTILVYESIKRKKAEQKIQEKEFQQAIKGTPKPILLKPENQPQKTYDPKEQKLRQEHRLKTIMERKQKRRQLFNEFTSIFNTENKPPQKPININIQNKTYPNKNQTKPIQQQSSNPNKNVQNQNNYFKQQNQNIKYQTPKPQIPTQTNQTQSMTPTKPSTPQNPKINSQNPEKTTQNTKKENQNKSK